ALGEGQEPEGARPGRLWRSDKAPIIELSSRLLSRVARESHEPHREFTPARRIRRLAHFWSRAQWRGCSFPSEIALGRGAAIPSDHNVPFRCGSHGRRCKLRLATLRTARDTPLPAASIMGYVAGHPPIDLT